MGRLHDALRARLEKPDPRRALTSALTIGGAYAAGGFIPLAPYIALASIPAALIVSVIVTLVALGLFGWVKGHSRERRRSAAPSRRC